MSYLDSHYARTKDELDFDKEMMDLVDVGDNTAEISALALQNEMILSHLRRIEDSFRHYRVEIEKMLRA